MTMSISQEWNVQQFIDNTLETHLCLQWIWVGFFLNRGDREF